MNTNVLHIHCENMLIRVYTIREIYDRRNNS